MEFQCKKTTQYLLYLSTLDVDECFPAKISDEYLHLVHNCHADANCSNTKGSFYCTCRNGYSGNGAICVGRQTPEDKNLTFTKQNYLKTTTTIFIHTIQVQNKDKIMAFTVILTTQLSKNIFRFLTFVSDEHLHHPFLLIFIRYQRM